MKRVIHTRGFTHRHLHWLFGAIAVVLLSLAPAAQAATKVHQYTFDEVDEAGYLDSVSGVIIDGVTIYPKPLFAEYTRTNEGRHLLGDGNIKSPNNNGLTLTDGLVDTSDYSIVLVFQFDTVGSETSRWKKIIDFKDRSVDTGLYTQLMDLNFYNTPQQSGTLTENVDAHVVLTRDGISNVVSVYLNGDLQFSFDDGPSGFNGLAIPGGNILTFFEDDNVSSETPYPEYHTGSVDDIEVYDGALSPTDVRTLYNAWAGIENTAPVANNDSYLMRANTVFSSSPDSVLDNDADVDDDDLTAVIGATNVSNGSLSLSDDGTFSYTPNTNFCGQDSFTYRANDGVANSDDEATVTIEVNCPPVIVLGEGKVDLGSQAVQYSDHIKTVKVTAADPDDTNLDLNLSGEPANSTFSLSLDSCNNHPETGSAGRVCTWDFNGQVLDPGYETHTITFTPKDSVGDGTPATFKLIINAEDAEVTLAPDNDISAKVENPGGDDAAFSLFFTGWEFLPDDATVGGAKPGDLNNMRGFMELQPVGPGSTVTVACGFINPLPDYPGTGYDEEALFQCNFTGVPVNTYTVAAEVWGENYFAGTVEEQWKDVYYYGSDEDVFTVFDPSLGFTSGGGWFYWPETAVDSCLVYEYDNEGPIRCLEENEGPCSGYPGDKTSFGFNLEYNKKKNSAKGSLLLMRHTVDENCEYAGSYRVKSNAIEAMSLGEDEDGAFGWAAASGKAVYREPDLVDEGNYTFVMYVEDHGEEGCGQDPADVFRIVVRDKDGNDVDDLSFFLDGDEGGEGGQIECGNILVPHKAGKKGDGDGGGGPKEPNPNKPPKG